MAKTIATKMIRTAFDHMGFAGDHTLKGKTILLTNTYSGPTVASSTLKLQMPILMPEDIGTKSKITRFGLILFMGDQVQKDLTFSVPVLKRAVFSDIASTTDLVSASGTVGIASIPGTLDTIYTPTITMPAAMTIVNGTPGLFDMGTTSPKPGIIDFREEDYFALVPNTTGIAWSANNSFNPMDMAVLEFTIANNAAAVHPLGLTFYAFLQRKRN